MNDQKMMVCSEGGERAVILKLARTEAEVSYTATKVKPRNSPQDVQLDKVMGLSTSIDFIVYVFSFELNFRVDKMRCRVSI